MWLSVTALPVAQTLRADCQRQLTKNTICTLPSLTKEDCLYFHSSTGLRLSYFCFVTFFIRLRVQFLNARYIIIMSFSLQLLPIFAYRPTRTDVSDKTYTSS